MRSGLIRVPLIILVLVGLGALVYFKWLRPDPVPVTVYKVTSGRVEAAVTNSKAGTIKSRRRATLSPEIGGRVVEIAAREGDVVAAGDLLMRLADEDYRAEIVFRERSVSASRAGRKEACLAAEQADREYVRSSNLRRDEIVSEELLEQLASRRDVAVAGCESAGARVAEFEAALRLARVQQAKTRLLAPFDGIVAEVSTELGEWITPSPPGVPIPPVIELIQSSAMFVSAPLDEVDLARIRVGFETRITMDAYPDRSFSGRVTRIAPYVLDFEEHSRTVEVEVEFDDAEFATTLLPGSSADIEVILDARDDVLRIPSYALIEGDRVLLLEGEGLTSREVTTGLQNWAFAEVTDGLSEGEQVVVSLDRVEIKEGARAFAESETDR